MKRSAYWDVKAYDISAAQRLAEALQVSPAITGILMHRGLTDETSMKEFLFGKAEPYYDPFLLKDMERAARRIQKAREAGEKMKTAESGWVPDWERKVACAGKRSSACFA